ncbi:MAG: copper amine oxidase N-terminal domain-containing protein [Hydrogenibacillus sp.]|nr:copper amine oxidase N-terminal domain-containing protein [Hydrogenibacillus sp.]
MRTAYRLLAIALTFILALAYPSAALRSVHAASSTDGTAATSPNSSSPSLPSSGEDGQVSPSKQEDDGDDEDDEDEKEKKDEKDHQKRQKKESEHEKEHKNQEKLQKASEKALEKYRNGLAKALEKVKGTPAEETIQRLHDMTIEEVQALLERFSNKDAEERKDVEDTLKSLDDETLDDLLTQSVILKLAERSVQEQAQVLKELVKVYEKLGKKMAALSAQEQLLQSAPKDREAYRKLGRLLKETGAADGIRVYVNGQPLTFEVAPKIENGRTLAPIRAIAEALGLTVDWNEKTREVTLSNGDKTVTLQIGEPKANVDGQTVTLDVPPTVEQGRTLVPLRFISEALGADVEWVPEGQVVAVTTP